MRRAESAVVVGVMLVLLGFGAGTYQPSATIDGASVSCGAAIDLRRLPFNEAELSVRATVRPPTADARRVEAVCRSVTRPLRLSTWSGLAVGGLVALSGWTALREREGSPAAASGASRRT